MIRVSHLFESHLQYQAWTEPSRFIAMWWDYRSLPSSTIVELLSFGSAARANDAGFWNRIQPAANEPAHRFLGQS